MNDFKLRIVTSDSELIRELLKDKLNQQSNKLEMFPDCEIIPLQKYEPSYAMVETPEILAFTVSILSNIAVGLFANWLFDLMKKNKVQTAEINGKKVENDSQDKLEHQIKIEITICHETNRKPS